MRVVELKNLSAKETPLHYRKEFNATAVIDAADGKSEIPVNFTVERLPVGGPDINVSFQLSPAWPVVPLIHSIKDKILDLDRKGQLP